MTTAEASTTLIPVDVTIEDHNHCLVCYSDLTLRGKTPCEHDDICGVCHLRLRHLHSDKKCPICKTENPNVIVDNDDNHKRFAEYPMWGDEIGAAYTFRESVGMFFPNDYYQQEILPLFGYPCHECDFNGDDNNNIPPSNESGNKPKKPPTPFRLLQDHLRTNHRKQLCQLCVDHKRDFVAKLPRMSHKQIQQHLRVGDGPSSGFSGHPVCEFCHPKRFYDLAILHQHLHKEHYECHICRQQDLPNQFFRNYASLERHFDTQHFLCHDVQCLSAHFVVFSNELDLRAHELSVHGGTSTGSTKINLQFRTRRTGYDGSGMEETQQAPSDADFNYSLDGQAFVPAPLPTSRQVSGGISTPSDDNLALHPLHMQRTAELRQQAAQLRQQQQHQSGTNNAQESFPSLGEANRNNDTSSSAPLRTGWTSGSSSLQRIQAGHRSAGRVTDQDFPSLPASSGPTKKGTGKKGAKPPSSTNRHFAAMSSMASQPARKPAAANNIASWTSPSTSSNRQTVPNTMSNSAGDYPAFPPLESINNDYFPPLGAGSSATAPSSSWGGPAKATKTRSQLSSAAATTTNYVTSTPRSTTTANQQKRAPVPSISSTVDFPAPPTAEPSIAATARQMIMAQRNTPTISGSNDMFLTSSNKKVSLEEIKASMGTAKYKQLCNYCDDFLKPIPTLSPEGFIDQSATLFTRGHEDVDFVSFIPSLLDQKQTNASTKTIVDRALSYMQSLRNKDSTSNSNNNNNNNNLKKPYAKASGKKTSGWSSGPPPSVSSAVGIHQNRNASLNATQPTYLAAPKHAVVGMTTLKPASSNNSAWGSGGSSNGISAVVRNNNGTTTTTGATTQKKPSPQQQQSQSKPSAKPGGKKNKNKNKNELRALAFGN